MINKAFVLEHIRFSNKSHMAKKNNKAMIEIDFRGEAARAAQFCNILALATLNGEYFWGHEAKKMPFSALSLSKLP